jgi:DivIVA domain-containing protein
VTSQGQRFRRRALRRGYKVDEVDLFLDRVEATLNSERVDAPVRSEEVRDVVFRVRFGGYDEWQVDLHLDRVERQLADQEPATFGGDRVGDRMGERLPERMPSGGMGGPGMAGPGLGGPGLSGPGMSGMPGPAMAGGMGAAAAFDRGPGERPPIGVSQRDLPPRGEMPRDMPPREMSPRDLPPRGADMPRDDRMMPPNANRPPMGPPPNPQSGWSEPGGPPQRPPYPGFPTDRQAPSDRPLPERQPPPLPERPPFGGGNQFDNEPTFAGFEPGRRGRPDMTSEMRLPDLNQPPPPSAGAPPAVGPSNQAPSGPPMGGGAPSGEADRIDQLRRTFQLRRFGSGYDRGEVDRLFDGLIGAMSGRGSMSISDSELDPQQFSLVPGGYFESEVDQALREIREIIRRR